jgi:preprotein translocase SecE subunit
MAVAAKEVKEVTKDMETPPRPTPASLPSVCVAGAAYALLLFFIVYHLIPMIWVELVGEAAGLSGPVLRLLTMGLVLAAGIFFAPRILPAHPHRRTGVAVTVLLALAGFFAVYVICYLADGIFRFATLRGWLTEEFFNQRSYVGAALAGAAAFGFGRAIWRRMQTPAFEKRIAALDEQGWLRTSTYKPGQGRMMRRATLLAAMGLIAGAAFHFWGPIQAGMTGAWTWVVPFTVPLSGIGGWEFVIARMPGLSLTVVFGGLALWLTFRAVQFPWFADFLISAEAELNKVTWSTRKQLTRDTIVVLVVTFLLTAFLLLMDIFWVVLLRFIGVIKH